MKKIHAVQYEVTDILLRDCYSEKSSGTQSEPDVCFEHQDGSPFIGLGDTWWMGLCRRFSWPGDFCSLTRDRKKKGFTVVQIVAGLYPDMPAFDQRGANEAGFPREKDFADINYTWFDEADKRIRQLVDAGIMPCIVGCWGYYLTFMGMEKMKRHWRNIIARWSAFPVLWCLAGEAAMPYYLSRQKEADREFLKNGWAKIGRYVRKTDPFKRLITIHPTESGRDQLSDDSVLDFNMLQTGHGGFKSSGNTVKVLACEIKREPKMPVVVGEVNYEGIVHGTQDEIQRLTFWSSFLTGAADSPTVQTAFGR